LNLHNKRGEKMGKQGMNQEVHTVLQFNSEVWHILRLQMEEVASRYGG
jgi:hypothetical protein